MCDPVTLTTIAVGGFQIASGVQQGNAEMAVARYNARQQENEAIRTRNKGTEEENAFRESVFQQASRQRAQLAAGGVDVGTGSALTIQDSTMEMGEADALRIRTNFQDQATAMDEAAQMTLLQGRNARRAAYTRGIVGAASVGLGGLQHSQAMRLQS
jgi:hypothetical protein